MSTRITGTITTIDRERFFAIATDSVGVTYILIPKNFAQFSMVQFGDLEYGDLVEFIGIDGPKGKRAIEIRG